MNWWQHLACYLLFGVALGCVLLAVPFAVGAYLTTAYWFNASTSFAKPAVTLARCLRHVRRYPTGGYPAFIIAQLVGAAAATGLFRWLVPSLPKDANKVVVPHPESEPAHVG